MEWIWKVLVAGAVRRLFFRGWGNRFDIHPMVPRLRRPMSPTCRVCDVGFGVFGEFVA